MILEYYSILLYKRYLKDLISSVIKKIMLKIESFDLYKSKIVFTLFSRMHSVLGKIFPTIKWDKIFDADGGNDWLLKKMN